MGLMQNNQKWKKNQTKDVAHQISWHKERKMINKKSGHETIHS